MLTRSFPSRPFTTIQAVLEGACHMVAMQISAEPLVRKTLRQVFRTRAMVSVKPTKKGRKVSQLFMGVLMASVRLELFLLLISYVEVFECVSVWNDA